MARQNRPNPISNPAFYSYGSNQLGSKRIFVERQKYTNTVVPAPLLRNIVRTWTTDRSYGTINHLGNAVAPRTNRLKTLKFPIDDEQSYFALDFVADAWYDFSLRLKELVDNNEIYTNSPWARPVVAKAWSPIY